MYKISMGSTEVFNPVLNRHKFLGRDGRGGGNCVLVIMQNSKLFQLGIKMSVMCSDS